MDLATRIANAEARFPPVTAGVLNTKTRYHNPKVAVFGGLGAVHVGTGNGDVSRRGRRVLVEQVAQIVRAPDSPRRHHVQAQKANTSEHSCRVEVFEINQNEKFLIK